MNLVSLQLDVGKDASEHTKSHSVDAVHRNNHYTVYMPQTQGLFLKFL